MSAYPPIRLDQQMPFGQYKGVPVKLVAENRPDYLEWLQCKGVQFTEELEEFWRNQFLENDDSGYDSDYVLSYSDTCEAGGAWW